MARFYATTITDKHKKLTEHLHQCRFIADGK